MVNIYSVGSLIPKLDISVPHEVLYQGFRRDLVLSSEICVCCLSVECFAMMEL